MAHASYLDYLVVGVEHMNCYMRTLYQITSFSSTKSIYFLTSLTPA